MRVQTLKKAFTACGMLLCLGSAAAAQSSLFSEQQRKAIGEVVREYLIRG